ncbi:MAG: acyltransferase [Gemmatimonadaceae bacterium]|nr:acyltransferase [Gemmatimonadaceae bacterium]
MLFHEARPLLPDGPLRQFAANGFIGVGLFYVLSGFILAYTYLDPRDAQPIEKPKFWRARFARVYPVYLLALVVALPLFLPWGIQKLTASGMIEPTKAIVTAVANVALLQAWLPQTVSQWNAPGWSLSVEGFFYLVFPVIAVALTRKTNRTIALWAGAVWLAGMLVALVFLVAHPEMWRGGEPADVTTGLLFLKFVPPQHLPEFLIGTGCGIFFLRRSSERRPSLGSPAAVSMAVALVLGVILAAPRQLPYPLLHSGVLAPLFALLILSLASERGPLAAILQRPTLVLLGKASYAIYLLHEPLAAIMYKTAWSPFRELDPRLRFVLYLGVVIAVSVAVLYWYEEPARRFIRNLGGRGGRPARQKSQVALGPVPAEKSG